MNDKNINRALLIILDGVGIDQNLRIMVGLSLIHQILTYLLTTIPQQQLKPLVEA